MKARKTVLILGVITLVAVFLSGCYHRGFGESDFPQRTLERIDDHVKDLQLTADQEEKYQALRARLEADLIKQKASHQTFKAELLTVIDRQDSGVKDLTAELRKKVTVIPTTANLYLDYIDEFYDILDDQQRALVMEEIRDKADNRHFRR
jgi:FtsZ-interacting cell division protein ZipA